MRISKKWKACEEGGLPSQKENDKMISVCQLLFTDCLHIEDHDEGEWYQPDEGRNVRQYALRGIQLIEDVTETRREENGWWAIEHHENAEGDDGRYFP